MQLSFSNTWAFTIAVTVICMILAFSFVTLNRAFIIGTITGIMFLLFAFKKVNLSRKALLLSTLLFLSAVFIMAIYVKSDSSLGRLLIYKISWNMFTAHPIVGIGWANFQREYGLHQAAFFQAGNYTQKEFLLAGNTFYAFNDYWEFIVETGMIGAVLLFLSLYVIVKLAIIRFRNEPNDHFLKVLLAFGLVVGVAAFFTHVFEYKPFKILMAFILSYLVIPQGISVKKPYFRNIALSTATIITTLFLYHFELLNIGNFRKWEEAKTLSATGYVLESQKRYAELYPCLSSDIGFLKDYNDVLTGRKNAAKKISLLKEILNRYTDNMSFMKLANVYVELGMNKQAELAYLKSVYTVPNRFIPKEALLSFYVLTKQYEKAGYYRNIILSMPIKVPSERIETIKRNAIK